MLTVLAINILMYCVSPQYVTFGSQHYQVRTLDENGTATNETKICELSWHQAEEGNIPNATFPLEDCVMTRNSALLMRFFYKAWFFGAAYYWFTWAFLVVSGISLVVVIVRKTRAITDDMEDEADSDLEELDDDPTRTRNRFR
jgi:LMBR1 domain-containing protein 1